MIRTTLKEVIEMKRLTVYMRNVRKFKGLTQEEFAEATGVSLEMIQKFESAPFVITMQKKSPTLARQTQKKINYK